MHSYVNIVSKSVFNGSHVPFLGVLSNHIVTGNRDAGFVFKFLSTNSKAWVKLVSTGAMANIQFEPLHMTWFNILTDANVIYSNTNNQVVRSAKCGHIVDDSVFTDAPVLITGELIGEFSYNRIVRL